MDEGIYGIVGVVIGFILKVAHDSLEKTCKLRRSTEAVKFEVKDNNYQLMRFWKNIDKDLPEWRDAEPHYKNYFDFCSNLNINSFYEAHGNFFHRTLDEPIPAFSNVIWANQAPILSDFLGTTNLQSIYDHYNNLRKIESLYEQLIKVCASEQPDGKKESQKWAKLCVERSKIYLDLKELIVKTLSLFNQIERIKIRKISFLL